MNVTNTAAKLETNLLGRSLSLVSFRFDGLRLERLRLGRLVAGLSLALAFSLPIDLGCGSGPIIGLYVGQSAMASVGSDVRLSQLEVKFFKHTYPKDQEAVRLERLEKMIFGEARTGASETRLKNLADTVPNLGSVASEDSEKSEGSSSSSSSSSGRSGSSNAKPVSNNDSDLDLSEERTQGKKPGGQVLSGESKYPAVTALEQSIFKRDYASDPVADRLNRLETKVFGKPSKFTDLSERVDALKEKTRVDVAKQAPPGTDWLDDEDDDISFPAPKQPSRQPVARSDGEDGRSFSGRDLRKDMQNAFGSRASGAASGGYGMGSTGSRSSSSNSASGAYGMGSIGSPRSAGRALDDEEDDDLPPVAPRRAASAGSTARAQTGSSSSGRAAASDRFDSDSGGAAVPGGAIGLSSKVTALENAVLGKTFASDPLIERVSRLEETVFPNKADSGASLSLPERVAKLVEKVPIAAAPPKTARANRSRRDDFDDDLDMGSGMSSLGSMGNMGSGMTSQSQIQTRGSGGLGKIINSIGNMLGGGYGTYGTYGGYANGYGIPGAGAMVRDPSTGFLVDSMSGNLINPATGQVVGRSAGFPAGAYGGYGTGLGGLPAGVGFGTGLGGLPAGVGFGYPAGMGMGVPAGVPMGGFSSFNNGFSPYGYPAGGYGLGGSGIRFGGSGFGVRF
jgi:hypothetical protein